MVIAVCSEVDNQSYPGYEKPVREHKMHYSLADLEKTLTPT